MASRNPYTRVRFPAHSSRLFRSKKSGRWTKLPGRRKNPISLILKNPRKGAVLIGRKVVSVVYLDEAKARRCGAKNPSIPWKHDFSSADAKVYGLPDGSVLIKSDKKKLWGYR